MTKGAAPLLQLYIEGNETMNRVLSACLAVCLSAITTETVAQLTQPNEEVLSELYSGKVYSPYADRTFPERPNSCDRGQIL